MESFHSDERGVFGFWNGECRELGFALDQGGDHALTVFADEGVAFPVANVWLLFDDGGRERCPNCQLDYKFFNVDISRINLLLFLIRKHEKEDDRFFFFQQL